MWPRLNWPRDHLVLHADSHLAELEMAGLHIRLAFRPASADFADHDIGTAVTLHLFTHTRRMTNVEKSFR